MSVSNAPHFDGPVRPELPPTLRRWSWGAFFLNWIWGLGNNTFIALLMFVPFVNLVMPFVLGVKGNAWAWRNGRWRDAEHFRRVQHLWAIWGFVAFVASILFFVGLFWMVVALMGRSEPYELGVAKLQSNPRATALLGTPIKAGLPRGSIALQGQSGEASYNFPVSGPKAVAHASLEATRDFDQWTITSLKLKVDGQDGIVEIVAPIMEAFRFSGYRLTTTGQDVAKTSFNTADKDYALTIDYRRPVVGTRIAAAWVQDKTSDAPEKDIVTKEFTLDANAVKHDKLTFDITTGNGLVAGDYHVDVSVNGRLTQTIPFKVVAK